MKDKQVLELLRNTVKKTGTQRLYAEQIGISPQFLSDVLNGHRGISDTIASALGLERQWAWKNKPK